MAQDLEQLVLSISADTAQMRRALKRLEGDVGSSTKKVEKQFANLGKKINNSFLDIGKGAKGALAFLGVGVGLQQAKELIDASTRISNALKVAGLEGEALNQVYASLFASAQKNAAPLEDLVTLYSRASQSAKDLGVTQQELLKFTDNVALSLRVGGKSAAEASGALLQLSQALGNGVVQAEEYNSLLDGAQPLLQATAAGLKEAGGSVSALTRLVKDGKVSSEAFFRAFEAGASILQDKVAGSEETVSQGFVRLQNVLIDTAGKMDDATGASDKVGKALQTMASIIEGVGNIVRTFADSELAHLATKLYEVLNPLGDLIEKIGGLQNLPAIANAYAGAVQEVVFGVQKPQPRQRTSDEILRAQLADASRGDRVGSAPKPEKTAEEIADRINGAFSSGLKPVTLADYKVPAKDKKGSKAKAVRDDDYQRETKQVQERIAAMKAETSAQALLNPLINDYGFAVEKARTQQDLLNAAKEAGKTITPELSAAIDQLSTAYATASADAERLTESQDKIKQSAEDFRDTSKDVMGGFISDLVDGKSAAEALAGALQKLGDKLLNSGLDALFGGGSSGGFGALGSLFGLGGGGGFAGGGNLSYFPPVPKFARGTSNAPGGLSLVGEQGPELVNLPRGSQVLPNIPTMKALSGQGGGSFTFAPVIDARGADSAAVARLEQVVAKQQQEFSARVVDTVRRAQKTRNL